MLAVSLCLLRLFIFSTEGLPAGDALVPPGPGEGPPADACRGHAEAGIPTVCYGLI